MGKGTVSTVPILVLSQKDSLSDLFARYNHSLWEDGRHKYNVSSFIGELRRDPLRRTFSAFDQGTLDDLIGTLRQRGNSNATINRKMAALSKLLRKAYKMGDIHSLPEFRRQKERAGRIRFLELEEEDKAVRRHQAAAARTPTVSRSSWSTPAAASARRSG